MVLSLRASRTCRWELTHLEVGEVFLTGEQVLLEQILMAAVRRSANRTSLCACRVSLMADYGLAYGTHLTKAFQSPDSSGYLTSLLSCIPWPSRGCRLLGCPVAMSPQWTWERVQGFDYLLEVNTVTSRVRKIRPLHLARTDLRKDAARSLCRVTTSRV